MAAGQRKEGYDMQIKLLTIGNSGECGARRDNARRWRRQRPDAGGGGCYVTYARAVARAAPGF